MLERIDYRKHINQDWKVQLLAFPKDAFPAVLADIISEGEASINCSGDYIFCSVLSTASAAVGNNSEIEIKKGWREGGNLYIAIVGEPGYKKTPALKLALSPIHEIQRQNKIIYMKLKDEYNKEVEEHKKQKGSPKPVPPRLRQIITTDATIEAVGQLLNDNTHGLLVWKDELIGWLKGMNQYKGGSGDDMEKYLSFWSRTLTIINRITKGEALQIDSPFITIIGGIQNDLLQDLGVLKENGFVNRILFSFPEPLWITHSDSEISNEVSNGYIQFIIKLFEKQRGNYQSKKIIPFCKEAYLIWVEWHKAHCEEMNEEDMPYYLRGAWSKIEAYTARFCLILEHIYCCEEIITPEFISERSVINAIRLSNYFKSHARKSYDNMYSTDLDKRIQKAFQWIKKRGGKTDSREFYSHKVAGCKTAPETEMLFTELKKRSLVLLFEENTSNGGKKILCHLKSLYPNVK